MNDSNKKPADASQKSALEIKGRYSVSRVFSDGVLLDMVYKKDSGKPAFAIAREGDIHLSDAPLVSSTGQLTQQKSGAVMKLIPHRTVWDLVDKSFIHLASQPEEYGTVLELYQNIREVIRTYVVLADTRFYDVAAGYVLMSWVFDRFGTVPYLRVVGDLGTGKSRFLEVVGKLCNRAMLASGSISMAAVFRTLDIVQGTLVFDEADFKSSEMSDEIVKLLNGGHKKDTPVIRMEKVNDVLKPMPFRVFGPKLLGSRRNYSDAALESRCITLRLYPVKNVDAPVHLPQSFDIEAQMLRNKLLMYRLRNFYNISDDVNSLEGLELPRVRQTALALTSIVKGVSDDAWHAVRGFLKDHEKSFLDTVATDPLADVLLCIAIAIEEDSGSKASGHLYMHTIAYYFRENFYDDHAERETREVTTRDRGVLKVPGQVVSPRKIGSYIDQLGIRKARDSEGVYIPIAQEIRRINALLERYGIDTVMRQRKEKGEEKSSSRTPRSVVEGFVKDDTKPF